MTSHSPRVAVVVTCYELGRTLGDALASVHDQTHAPAEIVVVDDGSRDPFTRRVLSALEPPVTVLRVEHGGPAAARNAGIERTRSELVLLLDGDDLLAPTYLERAASLLGERPDLAFVSCGIAAFGNASYRWTPPPYTIAESIARGACGHISTVFRRTLWETVGGFDASLPAYEDLDFWLSALEHGFVGEIIDEPLLHYRVRRGSRYETAIGRNVYQRAKEAILCKHRASVEADGRDVLALMLDFEREIREHGNGLRRAQSELEEQIREYDADRAELSTALRDRGVAPIDWGDLRSVLENAPEQTVQTTVHAWYVETFVGRHRSSGGGHILEVTRAGDLPASRRKYDSIVLVDVLADVPDPGQSLAAYRKVLKPGGTLFATFPCLPSGEGERQRLFTEASVRALTCSVFDPAEAEVDVFGNLPAMVASVTGLDAGVLTPEQLLVVDDSHPVTIGIRAHLPSRRARGRGGGQNGRKPREADRPLDGNAGVVLMYHRVADEGSDPYGICTSPSIFREHMEHLAATCNVLPLGELAEAAHSGTLPQQAVAVTFDDGYLDNLEVASPILRELDIPATFFVCTEELDAEHEPWWEVLEHAILDGFAPAELKLRAGAQQLALPTRSEDERRRALVAVHAALIEADVRSRSAALDQLLAWNPDARSPRQTRRAMTRSELRELGSRPGTELGAHTVHHLMLPAHDADVCRQELLESKIQLEELLGRPVMAVAFPYGAADRVTTSLAEEVGFTTGWSVDADFVSAESDPLRLPRFDHSQAGGAIFSHSLNVAFGAVHR
jgi:peptidoglycan/xylan/chitin deacetylase (PgdA/CDA1 family)/glycosyltransferase involved in cell wall biosynthesis